MFGFKIIKLGTYVDLREEINELRNNYIQKCIEVENLEKKIEGLEYTVSKLKDAVKTLNDPEDNVILLTDIGESPLIIEE